MGFASKSGLLEVEISDGTLNIGQRVWRLFLLKIEDFTGNYSESEVPQEFFEMILDNSPEGNQLAIHVIEDFNLRRGLSEENPRGAAERLAITHVISRDLFDNSIS